MSPLQGALIGVGFVMAVFALALGAGMVQERWKARKDRREADEVRAHLKKVADDFMTERASGVESERSKQ